MKNAKRIVKMNEIKTIHKGHFFEPLAMKFFNSRLARYGFENHNGEIFFVTSESFDSYSPRRYSVRVLDIETGRIETMNNFQSYETKQKALGAIRKVLKFTGGDYV